MGVRLYGGGSLGIIARWWCSYAIVALCGEFTYCGTGIVGYSVNVRFTVDGLESVASSLVAAFSCSMALHEALLFVHLAN